MGYYGGEGPMVNGVLAMMLVIVIVCVGLRLYTRKILLNALGADDIFVIIAVIAQLVNNIFIGISSHYGLGQHYEAIGSPVIYIEAVKWELFSHATEIFSNGAAKCAVGVFLLRILRTKWHIWFVWINLFITAFFAIFGTITCIIHCLPVQKSWNTTLPGKCWMNFSTFGYFVASWYTISDFAFAILPWFVIWNLNMKKSDKMVVAGGLSLGILAGICGIVGIVGIIRQTTAADFASVNYLCTLQFFSILDLYNKTDTVLDSSTSLLVWSSTETALTVMCACIPMLRPLWNHTRYGPDRTSNAISPNSSYKMRKYAKQSSQYTKDTGTSRFSQDGQKYGIVYPEEALEKGSPYQKNGNYSASHNSDEIMLRGVAVIERTDEVEVCYEHVGMAV
ncbi:hypothetical protein N7495_008027 [Penicillium taxi]|uniref:uncharacterized protein n=1 Tax=Penicillium taxi TaxID=168475 RepID=UPI00254595E6|nr:uncharacterized protein N7495_008027 [Penicillium taxi]KAJ5887986.1 hypothetical protein N7495_008027 [Penicillium taxi]